MLPGDLEDLQDFVAVVVDDFDRDLAGLSSVFRTPGWGRGRMGGRFQAPD